MTIAVILSQCSKQDCTIQKENMTYTFKVNNINECIKKKGEL